MTTKLSQIRTELRHRVAALPAHSALPRERDLAEELGVSRTTLRQALRELLDAGLVYTIRGQGTFVSDTRIAKGTSLSGFTEDMLARGLLPSSKLIVADAMVARDADASNSACPRGRFSTGWNGSGSPTAHRCASKRCTCRPTCSPACWSRTSTPGSTGS